MAKNRKKSSNIVGQAQLTFYIPEGLQPTYTDNTTITHTTNEFILSFFQTEYPVINPNTPNPAMPKTLNARCVSQLILSPEHVKSLISMLDTNYSKHLEMVEQKEKEDGQEEDQTGE